MALLITKRTRAAVTVHTAADGSMHEASSRKSDGTHWQHRMIGEPNQRATVSFSRRTGGDVDNKTSDYRTSTGDYRGE
jgi:hypothetical protein